MCPWCQDIYNLFSCVCLREWDIALHLQTKLKVSTVASLFEDCENLKHRRREKTFLWLCQDRLHIRSDRLCPYFHHFFYSELEKTRACLCKVVVVSPIKIYTVPAALWHLDHFLCNSKQANWNCPKKYYDELCFMIKSRKDTHWRCS